MSRAGKLAVLVFVGFGGACALALREQRDDQAVAEAVATRAPSRSWRRRSVSRFRSAAPPVALRNPYGVMSTPAVVVDERVVHASGVPSRAEVERWVASVAG